MELRMLFALFFSSAHAELPVLSTDHAVAIHISQYGLGKIGDAVAGILPPVISISAGSGIFSCSDDEVLNYELTDMSIYLSVDEVSFQTQGELLSLELYGTLSSSQAALLANGECAVFAGLDEECLLELPVTSFALTMDLLISMDEESLEEADGENSTAQLQVIGYEPIFDMSPIGNPIADCILADAVGTLLGQNEAAISDLILEQIEPSLADIPDTIEDGLEDALGGLDLSTRADLLGADLGIDLSPTRIKTENGGLTIGLGAELSVQGGTEGCIDYENVPFSEDQEWPIFDGIALDANMQYDAGIFIGRHLFDHLLYLAWASGALCIDVEELTGLVLTGEAVSAFFGEEVKELIGSEPVEMLLRPSIPPQTIFDDDQPPVVAGLSDFKLDLIAPVDERKIRLLTIDIDVDVEIFAELLGSNLELEMPLTEESFILSEEYSDFISSGYSAGVPNLLGVAMDGFTPDLPSLAIPSILGVSVEALVWLPAADESWQAGYFFLNTDDVEPLIIEGCSADSLGCDGGGPAIELDFDSLIGCDEINAGCEESSCSTGGPIRIPAGRFFSLLLAGCFVVIRRRS